MNERQHLRPLFIALIYVLAFAKQKSCCLSYRTKNVCMICTSLVPRPHPRGEEKGSGYNTTSRPTLEGRNQHTIVSDHVLTYVIYGILSMPRGPHCRAYYSNCAVIGHFTCQTVYVTGSGGMSYFNQTLLLWEGGVWA